MGGARLAVDRERECEPERGDVVRGRYGRLTGGPQPLELGEDGEGSVDRRSVGGFRGASLSLKRRRVGRGEGLNSSIRSVSGTGSIVGLIVMARPGPVCYGGSGCIERRRRKG